ncbi:hypothetical protein HZH66_000142 [Vespula vulgaris]|uniref:Uncharacterized protein n=1 Tax=Vespula vulgaris TaxID=7454 RepID=A0A834KQQ6_VESVU|nr:hypothetical protein HZH66_000142 [Vespula vulgaris]
MLRNRDGCVLKETFLEKGSLRGSEDSMDHPRFSKVYPKRIREAAVEAEAEVESEAAACASLITVFSLAHELVQSLTNYGKSVAAQSVLRRAEEDVEEEKEVEEEEEEEKEENKKEEEKKEEEEEEEDESKEEEEEEEEKEEESSKMFTKRERSECRGIKRCRGVGFGG